MGSGVELTVPGNFSTYFVMLKSVFRCVYCESQKTQDSKSPISQILEDRFLHRKGQLRKALDLYQMFFFFFFSF